MPVECQTVVDAGAFDGTPGAGLFSWAALDRIPRTTRVQILSISYASVAGAAPQISVEFFFFRFGGLSTERMLIARADPIQTGGPMSLADVRLCPITVPREPGEFGAHWMLSGFTENKDVTGTMCVDWVLRPWPDTDERGSR